MLLNPCVWMGGAWGGVGQDSQSSISLTDNSNTFIILVLPYIDFSFTLRSSGSWYDE